MRRTSAGVGRWSGLVLFGALVTSCVANATGPARTTGTYAHKAAATAAAAASSVGTVTLAAQAGADDEATLPYLSVLVSDAEDSLASVRTTFESILPPTPESQALRGHLVELLDRAARDVADARTAVRHGERGPLGELADRLGGDTDELAAFEQDHR